MSDLLGLGRIFHRIILRLLVAEILAEQKLFVLVQLGLATASRPPSRIPGCHSPARRPFAGRWHSRTALCAVASTTV